MTRRIRSKKDRKCGSYTTLRNSTSSSSNNVVSNEVRRLEAKLQQATSSTPIRATLYGKPQSRLANITGFLISSIFSLAYYVIPGWLGLAAFSLATQPFEASTWAVVAPILVSALIPPKASRWLLSTRPFQCIPGYFQYREVIEDEPELVQLLESDRPVLLSMHPHGVFSFCALCSACLWSARFWDPARIPTAVADSLISAPLLKHVVGVLGITGASGRSLRKNFNKKQGVILYPGGTSELFLTDPDHERIHLLDRKGFIRIALTEGAAVFPGYLFGNTKVLKLFQHDWLRAFSRRTGVAMTYFFGRFGLPTPLPEPCMTVIGKPLLLPKLVEPTQEEIDFWHAQYVTELVRVFDTYKAQAPGYEHKQLEIE